MKRIKTTSLEINYWHKNFQRASKLFDHTSPIENLRLQRRARLITDIINDSNSTKNKKVLEIGCGTGAYTEIFAKNGWQLTATDLMPEFLLLTKNKLKRIKLNKRPQFYKADAMKLPFSSNRFNAVIGNSILHHIIPVEKGLQEVYRVLRPSGVIAFTEPNMINPHIFLQKNIPFLKELAGDSPGETAFVRWRLVRQLKKQGFINVQVEPFDFLYPFMPVSLISLIGPFGLILERIAILREVAGSVAISAEKPKKSLKSPK